MYNKRLITVFFTIFISISAYCQTVKEISRNWTSFTQTVEVETDSIKKFKVVAYVKAEISEEKAWSGIWARVDNKPQQGSGFFDNMRDRPIKSNEWNQYTVEGIIDSNSEKIAFGGICLYNGKFFFDKFELFIEDDTGMYQPITLDNASFETKIKDRHIPVWNSGISRGEISLVKEFTSSSSEDKIDGEFSIMIEGKGISDDTGNPESLLPNIGVFASLLYLLLIIFSLMTYASSTDGDKWSNLGKIGFRFSFISF